MDDLLTKYNGYVGGTLHIGLEGVEAGRDKKVRERW